MAQHLAGPDQLEPADLRADSDAATPPVPVVPVDVAPASVCSAMSPMLCRLRLSASGWALSTFSWVPAERGHSSASRSTDGMPAEGASAGIIALGREIVRRWPVPTIFTVEPLGYGHA